MNAKNILLGSVVGGICMFLLGFILYAQLLDGFFKSNMGSATNVAREHPDLIFIFVGNLLLGLLLTIIYDRWAGIKTFATGAKAGAVIGLLMALGFNFIMYATTNISTMPTVFVDGLVQLIIVGISGGVIGLLLGRMERS